MQCSDRAVRQVNGDACPRGVGCAVDRHPSHQQALGQQTEFLDIMSALAVAVARWGCVFSE